MTKIATCLSVVLVTIAAVPAFAFPGAAAEKNTLRSAVDKFNRKAQGDPIGNSQPPLTENEVVAAIRGWIPEHTPGVADDVYEQFQKIAESRELPEDGDLSSCTGWSGYRGYRFTVWWIDLSIMTGENRGYTFRIRDQKISSRKMTPDELAEMQRRNRVTQAESPE